jgi:hypothetical protein
VLKCAAKKDKAQIALKWLRVAYVYSDFVRTAVHLSVYKHKEFLERAFSSCHSRGWLVRGQSQSVIVYTERRYVTGCEPGVRRSVLCCRHTSVFCHSV